MKLQHEFEVSASPEATLDFLLDPESVVSCMPGATLVEVLDDDTWKATMAVKLGPIGMDFLNDVRITERDETAGTVRLSVTGRDKRGKGRADASVDARISADEGVTRVSMDTDVKFSGQAAQLGAARGDRVRLQPPRRAIRTTPACAARRRYQPTRGRLSVRSTARRITLVVNGISRELDVEPRQLLVYTLREAARPHGHGTSAATRPRAAPAPSTLERRVGQKLHVLAVQADGRQ